MFNKKDESVHQMIQDKKYSIVMDYISLPSTNSLVLGYSNTEKLSLVDNSISELLKTNKKVLFIDWTGKRVKEDFKLINENYKYCSIRSNPLSTKRDVAKLTEGVLADLDSKSFFNILSIKGDKKHTATLNYLYFFLLNYLELVRSDAYVFFYGIDNAEQFIKLSAIIENSFNIYRSSHCSTIVVAENSIITTEISEILRIYRNRLILPFGCECSLTENVINVLNLPKTESYISHIQSTKIGSGIILETFHGSLYSSLLIK